MTTKKELQQLCDNLNERLVRLTRRVDWLSQRADIHTAAQERKINNIVEAIGGGIWRTMAGHARGIAFLSTEHLNNILLFPGASDEIKRRCQAELDRRNIDQKFREEEKANKGKKKPAPDYTLGRTVLAKCAIKFRTTPCKKPSKRKRTSKKGSKR